MSSVHGTVVLDVEVKVQSDEETNALLEANYTFNPETIIAFRLVAVDCKGNERVITVNDMVNLNLNEFIEH